MKAFSVIEFSTNDVLKKDFIKAGAIRNITPTAIYESSIQPWCLMDKGVNIGMKAISEINSTVLIDVINGSIPWVVREYPNRFPFLMPSILSSPNGVMLRTINNRFRDHECDRRH